MHTKNKKSHIITVAFPYLQDCLRLLLNTFIGEGSTRQLYSHMTEIMSLHQDGLLNTYPPSRFFSIVFFLPTKKQVTYTLL